MCLPLMFAISFAPQTKNADVISQNYATTFEQIASPFHGYSTDNDYSHITLILLLDSFEINFSSLATSNENAKNPIRISRQTRITRLLVSVKLRSEPYNHLSDA